ncbi:hypothetical protein ACQ4M4_23945 [Leptolyngbya sp. AN02str]|uniref:hypothetical protein n=1 Tax=Leptolyngbya sp. AN02str TaxID=3423363 RepID=UPI003D31C902
MKKLSQRVIYPVVLGLFVLAGLGIWALSRFEVSIETGEPSQVPSPELEAAATPTATPSVAAPTASVGSTPTPASPNAPEAQPSATQPVVGLRTVGKLRVSNQTNYPIRVALLAQQASALADSTSFGEPVHWDFAPQEGSVDGLILALPVSELNLETGDVVVAFAQDGSRRYWGPYVLGQTVSPRWVDGEWQLVIR